MATRVDVPSTGESVTEAVLVRWHKQDGDAVAVDDPLCELETDKATFDLPAPVGGVLKRLQQEGATVKVGEAVAEIDEAGKAAPSKPEKPSKPAAEKPAPAKANHEPAAKPPLPPPLKPTKPKPEPPAEKKEEVNSEKPAPPKSEPKAEAPFHEPAPRADALRLAPRESKPAAAGTRRVPMSKIRRSIAERLVRVKQTTAMVTTFNEIDMSAVMDLRKRYQEELTKAHGISLGLLSFFARATTLALKQFPLLNAEIDGQDIVEHDDVNLAIAVSTERGLVVPVLKAVQNMSLVHIEEEIKRVATAARDGKLSVQDLSGGTFTITNGGIFGSLLSTPILNPPQTGILGMHTIQKRPVVLENDRIRARPMMYVALTYDHRLIDGREAVLFLVRIKELIEDPARMLLES